MEYVAQVGEAGGGGGAKGMPGKKEGIVRILHCPEI